MIVIVIPLDILRSTCMRKRRVKKSLRIRKTLRDEHEHFQFLVSVHLKHMCAAGV